MQLTAVAKGKLERWHRTCRDQFLGELDERHITGLAELNARLWAWLEQVYHRREHAGLGGITPLARYQRDLARIRGLGPKAAQLDALFHHRVSRFVRKDGTVSYQGQRFELPYELSGQTVKLVVDPHAQRVVGVEDDDGHSLGEAVPLDAIANAHRRRRRADAACADLTPHGGPNLVEIACQLHHGKRTHCRCPPVRNEHFGNQADQRRASSDNHKHTHSHPFLDSLTTRPA